VLASFLGAAGLLDALDWCLDRCHDTVTIEVVHIEPG
jgi:hypothetical protein